MKPADRTRVLWLGSSPPVGFRDALAQRGLELKLVTELDLPSRVPAARAVVLAFVGDIGLFRARIRRVGNIALDHGLVIVLCASDTRHNRSFVQVIPSITARLPRGRYSIPPAGDWIAPAEWIARYNPGPDSNNPPTIVGCPAWVPEEARTLLARAFSDFERVRVKGAKSGFSGAGVVQVHPVAQKPEEPNRRLLPYIVKIDDTDRIEGERAKYWTHIAGTVPFNQRPNIDESRCVKGRSKALMVQDFVERALPLKAALLRGSPMLFLASLFEGALGECRQLRTPSSRGIVDALKDLKVLEWSAGLNTAAASATRDFGAKRTPAAIRLRLDGFARKPYTSCTIHGDLHAENVFVGAGSVETILIDFYKTTHGPSVADPAWLEVSLAFPMGEHKSSAALEKLLRSLYRRPLPVPTSRTGHAADRWLWEAVRAIRMFARAVEPSSEPEDPYVLAVACYLLKFASYTQNKPLRRRAFAYALADQLLP